ncbi:MAG: saccharopine dehydrogenase family protein, partial [Actinomycetota bacterium]
AQAGRGEARAIDVAAGSLTEALEGIDVVCACVPYRLNLVVMEAALSAGCHYADLGGLFHMTRRQLTVDGRFREAGLAAVIGIGSAPGITNLMARLGAERLDSVETIELLNGSIDEDGGFGVPYAPDTIIDEFTAPAMVFEEGKLREVPAASGAIRYEFPPPIGELEAVYTLHSELATLPHTIEGVRNVRWRLALPPAVAQGFKTLVDLGLASEDPVETSAGPVVPRDFLLNALRRLPAPTGPPRDVEATIVAVEGTLEGRPAQFTGTAMFRPTPERISAGAFGTAIPIAVAARWLADGRVEAGVHPPETAFPAAAFLEDLAAEGVEFSYSLDDDLDT